MKILVLCYEYPPIGGGGGRMAHSIGAALARRGHQLRVQTAWLKGIPVHETRDGVEICRTFAFRRRADQCSVPEMAGYIATSFLPTLNHLRTWKPDVIHAHFAVPTGALALASGAMNDVPYVLTAHLGDLPGGNPDQTASLFRVLNPAIRPIWRRAAALCASSSFAAGLAETAYNVHPKIILNGIAMQGRPACAMAPGPTLKLTAIGRFNPQKNFPWMISALATAGLPVPWHLTLVGDGGERPAIEAALRTHGIEANVTLPGWIAEDDMRRVLTESDVLLMPSTSEGNPIAAIEALKHGIAILGSDIGGLADLIEDGRNGFRVSLASMEPFQARLRELAADKTQLQKMKNSSIEVSAKFDIEMIADAYENVLQAAVVKNSG